MKKFAAFDIDGTLFRSGLYREVVGELIEIGALPAQLHDALADKHDAWRRRTHGRAFKEFEQLQVDLFEAELTKLKISDFERAAERVITKHRDNVYVYTRELAKSLKNEGYFLIAISGSQTELVAPFAEHYGFDAWIGQEYERGDEYFTGIAKKTHKNKGPLLQSFIDKHQLSLKDSVAIGDSAGDVDLLTIAEQPIAFNPGQDLIEIAMNNQWPIVVERKNVIYHMNPSIGGYLVATANA